MVHISTDICVSCGGCIDLCPTTAIRMVDDTVVIDPEKCIVCKICVQVCPLNAPHVTEETD